jgi:hypothetical protein
MESEVFGYFVSIGAGLSFGLSIGAIPVFLVWRWLKRKEGGHHDRFQAQKARS